MYIKFLSNTDELISGIIYGGLSKKKRNILQIGFYLNFNVNYKTNRPASINAELSEPYISKIINDKYKLNCLMSITSLINVSIIEGQKIDSIYKISDNFLNILFNKKKWFNEYCQFKFKFLKIIGYEIDFINNQEKLYFDLDKLDFCKEKKYNTIEFPYDLFDDNKLKINLQSINKFFTIFETVYVKNHLSNFNLKLPNQYILFKKLIIDKLK